MAQSKIEWTQKVWNPVTGCSKVSQGCKNCYAETMHKRLRAMGVKKYSEPFNKVVCHEDQLDYPFRFKTPTTFFVNSMSDLFHEDVPFEFIDSVFATMGYAVQHSFQILTKRPRRMKEYIEQSQTAWDLLPVTDIWLGVSIEDQATADERIPTLLQIPAAKRFVSCEPLLGEIELQFNYWVMVGEGVMQNRIIDWVIVGGESGSKARPMHPDWVRKIRDDCKSWDIPFFFKQWGKWLPDEAGETVLYQNGNTTSRKYFISGRDKLSKHAVAVSPAGKKKASALLDGKEYREIPI